MKKIMTLMLGLSLRGGAVTVFAADGTDTTKTKKVKKTRTKKTTTPAAK